MAIEDYRSDDHYTAYINDTISGIRRKEIRKDFFQNVRDQHDCHASPDDGCAGCAMTDEELEEFWNDKMAMANPDKII